MLFYGYFIHRTDWFLSQCFCWGKKLMNALEQCDIRLVHDVKYTQKFVMDFWYCAFLNGCHFFNIDRTENFPITDPLKVWVSGFPSVNRNGISVSAIMKKMKNGCHFFNIDHTEKFPITDIFAWWPFCTQKTGHTNFLSIQFSELSHWFSFPRHPS